MKYKNKLWVWNWNMVMILCVSVLFSGCNILSHEKNSGREVKEQIDQEEQISSVLQEQVDQTKALKPVRVCLVGNSLIGYGCQSGFLKDIALSYGENISVDELSWGGSTLMDYVHPGGLVKMKKKEIRQRIGAADIAVFQDYGGWCGTETVRALRALKKYCKKDAKLWYYMYDDDQFEMKKKDYRRLRKMGFSFIPKGEMIDYMYEQGYSYEILHNEGDFHPNNFNGYMAATVMHGCLFDKSCSDLPNEFFFGDGRQFLDKSIDTVIEGLQGKSEEEKWEALMKLNKKADELIRHLDKKGNL